MRQATPFDRDVRARPASRGGAPARAQTARSRLARPRAATRGRRLAVLLVLIAVAAACGDGPRGARTEAAIEVPDFDGEAAHALIAEQVAFGPRVPGTDGHARQLAWMEAYLRERADSVALQPFTHVTAGGDTLGMANVFASFRPEARGRILLVAHWDTRSIAEQDRDPARRGEPILGANDGASGVAVLFHLADVLSRHSPPLGVDLLFVDGEDYAPGEMYLGSTNFAANLPPGYRPLYGIVVDMVGDRNPVFPIEEYSRRYAPEVVERVWRLAEELGYGPLFPRRSQGAIQDDHIPLNRAGIRTIDIIDFDYGPGNRYWHTTEDVLENTGPIGLEAVGRVLTALIYRGG